MFAGDPTSEVYGVGPLQLTPRPSFAGAGSWAPGTLDLHLDALESRQRDDGGWPITFEPASPMGALEWRARFTLEALVTLRAYGRI